MSPVRQKPFNKDSSSPSPGFAPFRVCPEYNAPNHPCTDAQQSDSFGTSSGTSSYYTHALALFRTYHWDYACTPSNILERVSLGKLVGAFNLLKSVTSGPGPSLEWVFLQSSYVTGVLRPSRSKENYRFPGATLEGLRIFSTLSTLNGNVSEFD